jgi:hypothetical protein
MKNSFSDIFIFCANSSGKFHLLCKIFPELYAKRFCNLLKLKEMHFHLLGKPRGALGFPKR